MDCRKIPLSIKKGYEKVLLIDPHDFRRFGGKKGEQPSVPCINPIHYKAPAPAVVGNIMDSVRVLWGQKDYSETPRIQKYLPAVLTGLHASHSTIGDGIYFIDRHNPVYRYRREKILSALHPLNHQRVYLEEVFSSRTLLIWEGFFSTINRINPFFDPTMQLIFGSTTGIDFIKMVKEGWLILVNLDPEGVFGQEHQRLLGTVIINEIINAISRLRNTERNPKKGTWKGRYYLYIDEAGDYATRKISEILDKKRKTGLGLALSHQRFDQFADRDVASAVYGGTKIKVLFNTANREDRDRMIRLMYGGELSDREVSYTLSMLKKQYAAIKINKQSPQMTRLDDVPDANQFDDGRPIDDKIITSFKQKLYTSNPWYKSPKDILGEINNRFARPRNSSAQPPAGGGTGNSKPKEDAVYDKPKAPGSSKSPAPGTADDRQPTGGTLPVQQGGSAEEAYLSKKRAARTAKAGKLPRHNPTSPKDGE